MDRVMVFGFVVGFLTVVGLIYRRELRTRVPVLVILLSGSAVYGFLQGAWPLGCILVVMAASECAQWWRGFDTAVYLHHAKPQRHFVSLYERESRLTQMFGRG